jgi:AAA15 family ATPase/GTPase
MKMLLQIRFSNFLSYKNETEFFMTAAPIKEKNEELNVKPIFQFKEESILKVSAIFGANGSGKSNVLKAFEFFINTILNKTENLWQNFKNKHSNPFLLNSKTVSLPSKFELNFVIEDIEYRYGFETLGAVIHSEWLYKTIERETKIFQREKQEFHISSEYKIFKQLEQNKMIPEDGFLLTLSSQFNEPIARSIIEYFSSFYFFDSFDITSFVLGSVATPRLREPEFLQKVLNLLKAADTGIQDIKLRKDRETNVQNQGSLDVEILLNLITNKQNILSLRNVFDDEGNIVSTREFIFSKFESEGTRKFFDIAANAIEILEKGGVLLIDEMDTKFHPLLTKEIIKLFYNKKENPKNAQLIFTTHDVSLLDANLFRRDQIWFTEKDQFGVSNLFPLNEFKTEEGKGIRNDEAIAKNYLNGKYGAIPILAGFD